MRYIFTTIISVIFLSSCSTCIKCEYSDKFGTFTKMQEYCGKKSERDLVLKECQTRADSLDGNCICK